MDNTGTNGCNRQTTEDRLFDAIETGGHFKALELVKRADLRTTRNGFTLLHQAAIHSQSKIVGAIFKKMVDFAEFNALRVQNEVSKFNDMTALEIARKMNFPKVVRSIEEAVTVEKYQNDLHKAAKIGDVTEIRQLCKSGHDINKRGKFGETPLHVACGAGHLEAVKVLLDEGADYTIPTKRSVSVVFTAAYWGHYTILKYLLDNCPDLDVNCRDETYETALHGAADYGAMQIYDLLLEKGANHVANRIGETPMHIAAYRGNLEILHKMLQRPDDEDFLNERTLERNTPLHYAVHGGRHEMTTYLVREGAKVNAKNIQKTTPLHLAAVKGNLKICHLLMRYGADVNAAEKSGDTALHEAAENGNLPIVETLVENGVNVNAKNKLGERPLHKAAMRGHLSTVKFFIEFGALVDARTKVGDTALILAAGNGHPFVAEYLIRCGANFEILRNEEEKPYGVKLSALHAAVVYGHIEVVRVLLANSAPMEYDGCSLTPLHCAAMNADAEMITVLLGSTDEIIGQCARQQNDNSEKRRGSTPGELPMGIITRRDQNSNDVEPNSSNVSDEDSIGHEEDELIRQQFQNAYQRRRSSRRDSATNGTVDKMLERSWPQEEFEISHYRFRRGSNTGGDEITAEEDELIRQQFQLYNSRRRSSRNSFQNDDVNFSEIITAEEDQIIRRQFQALGSRQRGSRGSLSQQLPDSVVTAEQISLFNNGKRRCSSRGSIGSIHLNDTQSTPGRMGMPRQSIAGPLGLQELFSGNWSLVDITDTQGRSPLHLAAEKGSIETVRVLLENGADVNRLTKQKRGPLHFAAARGHTEVVKLLLDEGSEINQRDRYLLTARDVAENKRHDDVVDLLEERGAKDLACVIQ
ncbi:ankyrin-1-like isoform X2 [Ptychodera flava]|uniref:ankyrin-1-like isoform X2 n=1 Tax=Ptychodera flava TaxID=63121 RepID=UPI00396A32A4